MSLLCENGHFVFDDNIWHIYELFVWFVFVFQTPLHYAAGNGHLEVVKELVSRGADIDAKNVCNWAFDLFWMKWKRNKWIELNGNIIELLKCKFTYLGWVGIFGIIRM